MTTLLLRETMDRAITVINCNDWGWKWVFRGLWRGWGPRRPNLEGRRAACRPSLAQVIVPMCSVQGHIPWGTAHTGGHLKAYLDVAAIRVRTSTQGSNLFQLLERARSWGNRDETMHVCGCGCAWGGGYGFIWTRSWLVGRKNMSTPQCARTRFSYSSTHLWHNRQICKQRWQHVA